ncbi:MAG: hypothetical protein HYX78_11290 [Armatimonadetes bacterium]|nr:hypothetical protein [Armatimonadota bacterium]
MIGVGKAGYPVSPPSEPCVRFSRTRHKRTDEKFETRHDLTPRRIEIMLAGGMLNYIRQKAEGNGGS